MRGRNDCARQGLSPAGTSQMGAVALAAGLTEKEAPQRFESDGPRFVLAVPPVTKTGTRSLLGTAARSGWRTDPARLGADIGRTAGTGVTAPSEVTEVGCRRQH